MANEIDIDFGTFDIDSTNNISVSGISLKEKKSFKPIFIPKSDGSVAETGKRESLTINVEGDIKGTGHDNLRTSLDALRAAFQDGKQKFTTDDDRYIMAQLQSFDFDYTKLMLHLTWKARFIAHYPFWLSETESTDDRTPTSGAGYTINNGGNAPTRVKVEITASGGDVADNCQLENTTRGEIFQYTGTISSGNVLEVDNRYDTDDFEVLNDGTDDHVNFEGDFINLSPGNNTIEFTGTASTDVKLYWRDAYY